MNVRQSAFALRKKHKKFSIAAMVILCSILVGTPVYAEESDGKESEEYEMTVSEASETEETLLEEFDFTEIDEMLEELFPEEGLKFGEVIRSVMKGETTLDAELFNQLISDQLFRAFRVNRESMIHLILIAVGAALFLNFADVFQTRQVSEISFFLLYLLLIGVCLTSFQVAADWVENGLGQLTGFMKVLYPLYFVAVTAAKGSVTSLAFYHLALVLILVIDSLMKTVILSMIHIYVVVRILNSMQSEDYLSKFAELLEMGIQWTLKTVLGCMVGLNVIQGLVAPAIDSLKQNIVTKSMEAIPGVGDVLGGTTEVVLGTAVLIKNSIGFVGALICCGICLAPLVQIAVITLAYKLTAAVVQPVSDKRIVECIGSVGEGCRLLLRTVFTSGVLFLLTIAIVAYTTGKA